MDPKFGDFAIYEHCQPFNVALRIGNRAFDEASGNTTTPNDLDRRGAGPRAFGRRGVTGGLFSPRGVRERQRPSRPLPPLARMRSQLSDEATPASPSTRTWDIATSRAAHQGARLGVVRPGGGARPPGRPGAALLRTYDLTSALVVAVARGASAIRSIGEGSRGILRLQAHARDPDASASGPAALRLTRRRTWKAWIGGRSGPGLPDYQFRPPPETVAADAGASR